MAITIDYLTKIISVPQADLTFISGTLYEMDIDVFRRALNDIADSEEGITEATTHTHNTEVTISGTTLARQILMINGYSVEFTPDAQYSVRLAGANTDLWDIEAGKLVQNQVQVIPGNSAGLISGQTILDVTQLLLKIQRNKFIVDPGTGLATVYDDDGTTILIQGPVFEDAAGTIPYAGNKADRRERLV